MLGESKAQREYQGTMVTQAAWVRSLIATFVKQWEGKIGGLFGAPPKLNDPLLPWNRPMQAAFLIFAGNALRHSVKTSKAKWALNLRHIDLLELFDDEDDRAFYGNYSMISSDQGIRGFLYIINDLCFLCSQELGLEKWRWEDVSMDVKIKPTDATDEAAVSAAIESFAKTRSSKFIIEVTNALATFDWRLSSTPDLNDEQRMRQANYRGGPGYKEMRRQLLIHLINHGGEPGKAAQSVQKTLQY